MNPNVKCSPIRVLLVYPPVGSIVQCYLATPLLVGFLRGHGVDAEQWDANIDLAHALLSRDCLEAGADAATRRLRELEARPYLAGRELKEYALYTETAPYADAIVIDRIEEIKASAVAPIRDPATLALLSRAFDLASCKHFQATEERFDFTDPASPAYGSVYSPFSSRDLVAGAEDERSMLSEIFRQLVPARLEASAPDIVGISITFSDQILPAVKLGREIKRWRPETWIVLGGAYVSAHFRELENVGLFRFFDMLIFDEGETPLLRLVDCFAGGKTGWEEIPNTLFLRQGRVFHGPSQSCKQTNGQPSPCYEGIDLGHYFLPRDQVWLPFRLSQGCYWDKCTFCEYSDDENHLYVESSVEAIAADLRTIVESLDVRRFHFVDAALHPKLLKALSLRLIQEDLAIEWHGNVRLERSLTPELCSLLRRAGCVQVESGVETANDRLLKLIKKGAHLAQIETAVGNLRGAGIHVHVYMIVGLPTETLEEAVQSYTWVERHLRSGHLRSVAWHLFFVTPGSHIFSHPEEYSITKVKIPSELDLQVEAWEFECQGGMSRPEARELFKQCLARTAPGWLEERRVVSIPEGRRLLDRHLFLPPEIVVGVHRFDLDEIAERLSRSSDEQGQAKDPGRIDERPSFRLTNLRTQAAKSVTALGWSALQRANGAATIGEIATEIAVETARPASEVGSEIARMLAYLEEGRGMGVLLV